MRKILKRNAAAEVCCLLPVPANNSLTHWGSVIRQFSLGLLFLVSFLSPKLRLTLRFSLPLPTRLTLVIAYRAVKKSWYVVA